MKMAASASTMKALGTGQEDFFGFTYRNIAEICSHEEVSVRDQRENKPKKVSDKEDNGDRQRKVLCRVGRPIARLPLSRGVKNRRNDQPDHGKAERGRGNPGCGLVESLMWESRSADQNRSTQDEENVAEDRARDRGLHHHNQSLG